jgi:mxaC protein
MSFNFEHGTILWLLPLALLPWLTSAHRPDGRYAALRWVKDDLPSRWAGRVLRASSSVAIASLLVALAAPRTPETAVETVARGAEIVVLLDRSLSMDQPFGRGANVVMHPEGRSKAQVAEQVIGEFAKQRTNDLFGLVLFSTLPLPALALTRDQDAIQAAIGATGTSRALGDTDVGLGLLAAASYFNGRPYAGSRVIVLVSDGGAQLDPVTRQEVADALARNRISLYWMYIRSRLSPRLSSVSHADSAADDAIPEVALDRFFRTLKTPYRLYEAEDADALQRAIDDLARLERAPLELQVLQPGLDLRRWPLAAALAATLVLAAASLWTIQPWQTAR